MRTYFVYYEERVLRYKKFTARNEKAALKMAKEGNPATWNITGDYSRHLVGIEEENPEIKLSYSVQGN